MSNIFHMLFIVFAWCLQIYLMDSVCFWRDKLSSGVVSMEYGPEMSLEQDINSEENELKVMNAKKGFILIHTPPFHI